MGVGHRPAEGYKRAARLAKAAAARWARILTSL
jgi:hypothetical protein